MHFSWFNLVVGDGSAFTFLSEASKHEAYVIPTTWAICLFTIGLALLGRSALEKAKKLPGNQALIPDSRLTIRNSLEILIEALFDLAVSVLGKKDAKIFFPLIGGLFVYILFSNLIATLPGFLPPSSCVNNNLAMALVVFLVFNIAGLYRNGFGYIKHLFGPIILMAPFFFIIEAVGLIVRPVSLSLRLGGNLFGDHMVLGIMSDLFPVLLPVPFIGLGIFVSFIQALVFSLLSTVYIGLAVAHEDEH